MTNRCVAALGLVLAFGATAASSAEKHRDLHVVIETIDHSKQRYPTVGDWQIDKAGNLRIAVSKMSAPGVGGDISSILNKIVVEWAAFRNKMALSSV